MEDNFLNPTKKKVSPLSSQGTAIDSYHDPTSPAEEESGWTTYLEDFSKQRSQYSYCSSLTTSSMVSDADSQYRKFSGGVGLSQKKLSWIKKIRKNNEELESTASSPVHSPKVLNDFKRMEMEKTEGHVHSVASLFANETVSDSHEKGDGTLISGPDHKYTSSLKKRGLCLVPVSLLANYIG